MTAILGLSEYFHVDEDDVIRESERGFANNAVTWGTVVVRSDRGRGR